jgi:hypothetical protein
MTRELRLTDSAAPVIFPENGIFGQRILQCNVTSPQLAELFDLYSKLLRFRVVLIP